MKAVKILARGVVQGVGFRPFVYRVATQSGVKGYVKNIAGSAVEILIEGPDEAIKAFIKKFYSEKPTVAVLEEVILEEVQPIGFGAFQIFESDLSSHHSSMIPQDMAICDECLGEVLAPKTRWSGYPFNSCAYCGPRYSIIERIPYDRANTSMRDFPFCPECLAEYRDPENKRRFHAQGISCPSCGPKVWLADRDFNRIDSADPIAQAAELIDEGFIVAVKGLGGLHIAALASDDDVVMRLRTLKNRPSKPFAVMARDILVASSLVKIGKEAKRLLESPERPILLLKKKEGSPLSSLIAPGLAHVGVFLPYTALHYLLLDGMKDRYAIMTSGNPPNEPMCTDEECARVKLSGYVDFFLLHNRRIVNRVDDSVLRFTDGRPILLRRGRGYAPRWVKLPFKLPKPVVAFGAMLQSAAAVAFEDRVVLTQYIGDVDEFGTFMELDRYLRLLMDNYKLDPADAILVCDMHPRYPSTLMAEDWARRYGNELAKVQHHWAHLLAVMAEYGLVEEAVGIAIDGLGYGPDGTIWGGEVMRLSYSGYERVGNLRLQKMPGGDLAVTYPARMLISILSTFMNEEELARFAKDIGLIEKGLPYGERELSVIMGQLRGNAPLTSSLGRVLDASAALLGVAYYRSYEGEPAMRLEAFAKPVDDLLPVKIHSSSGSAVLDTSSLIASAVELTGSRSKEELAYLIQYSLGYGLGEIAVRSAKSEGVLLVSGGAAVNDYIIKGIKEAAREKGIKILLPKEMPANDGGIPLGQVAAILSDSHDYKIKITA